MATLDYVDIPAGATRLRASTSTGPKAQHPAQGATSSDLRPAPRVYTPLPHPSPPPSPASAHRRQVSLTASAASSLMSPTLAFIPQLLLSAAIPGGVGGSTSTEHHDEDDDVAASISGSTTIAPRQQSSLVEKPTLLSTRDPLSLPIMSNNFKRFVAKVGPVFWLQDRIEEVVLWKKGWRVTGTWMAAYVFLCWYPRMVLLLPHVCIVAVILATYPYPGVMRKGGAESQQGQQQQSAGTSASSATEGNVPWQANIQAIQNLMGAVSDLVTLAEPHVHHLVLSPAHFRDPANSPGSASYLSSSASSSTTSSPSSIAAADPLSPGPHAPQFQHQTPPLSITRPISPYTPHILTLLTITFPPLAYVISLPQFPIRLAFIIIGLTPFACTHPWVQRAGPKLLPWLTATSGEAVERLEDLREKALSYLPGSFRQQRGLTAQDDESGKKAEKSTPFVTVIQRVIDDDRLSDKCWNSEMREVELWENERLAGDILNNPSSTNASQGSLASSTGNLSGNATWSKANLRQGERSAWTRGRDGWSGVGVGSYFRTTGGGGGLPNAGAGNMTSGNGGLEVQGEVSSNLTFSLGPGWSFVDTEDWRKDILGGWSGVGADHDGWVYTNDAWLGARPAPYTAGGGSATRRRRWTRRVWYDQQRAEREA